MKFKNVLVLYKRSAYRIYFADPKSSMRRKKNAVLLKEKERFEKAHLEHYRTLKSVAKILYTHGVHFSETYRGRNIKYNQYDLVITVGGDGTFLEASRHLKDQTIVGINSAPQHSVGRFCVANANNFERILKRILENNITVKKLHRLQLRFNKSKKTIDALNDVLICHNNPAVLCRYYLIVGRKKEEQRSSGLWVATPSGSSGAMKSAGGRVVNQYAKSIQYRPRELYVVHKKYKLKGGVISPRQKLVVVSLMRNGMVYLDGAHAKLPFEYGATLHLSVSPNPIKTIKL